MNTLEAILARMAEVRTAIEAHVAIEGEPTEEQRDEFPKLLAEWDDLEAKRAAKVEENDKLDRIRSAALDNPTRTESGDDRTPTRARKATENIYDLSEVRSAPNTRERGADLRDRAMRAIDGWDVPSEHKESAEKLVRSAGRAVAGQHDTSADIAEHILRTSSPEYVDGFFGVLSNPTLGLAALPPEQAQAMRAALNEGTSSQGGYLVPAPVDPTIILTNSGTLNPFRQIATVKQITNNVYRGVSSAGVTAEWTAEAAEAADASPTFAQPTITAYRADAYVQASFEFTQDTSFASEIGALLADAKDRLEGTAFAVGTGSNQPTGIVTALGLVTASRVAGSSGAAGAADFVLADVYALAAALPPRHRPNASWLGEFTNLNKVRRFGEGTAANAAFWADLGVDTPPQLLGKPVYESSDLDSTIVSGSTDDVLILGDFRKYVIVDRVGMSVVYNPLVIGSNRRPTGEVGWFAFWRTGGNVVDANAFRMLRL